LLIRSQGIVTGVIGVAFFIVNAAFSLVLLIIVLVATIIALFAKNPDTRYQPMRDDRGSFIKSQSQLNTELDALGATARGEGKHGYTNKGGARIEDDDDSWSGGSSDRQQQQTAYQGRGGPYMESTPRSPIGSSAAGFGSDAASGRHAPPSYTSRGGAASPYDSRGNSFRGQGGAASPSPWQRGAGYD